MTASLREFASTLYLRDGVADCCLHWQDVAGADVNILLTAAWLAQQGKCWKEKQARELVELCAEWRAQCLLPLRALRRYLKSHPLYAQAKALELEAELYQLAQLEAAVNAMTVSSHPDALRENLRAYLRCIDLPMTPADAVKLHAALDYRNNSSS